MEERQDGALDAGAVKSVKKEFSRIGLALSVYLLLVSALQFLISLLLGFLEAKTYLSSLSESGWHTWIVAYLPQVLIAAPICLWMLRSKEPPEAFGGGLCMGNYIKILIASVPVMYIGSLIGNLISALFGAGNALQSLVTNSNIWATLLFAVVLAPVVEELIFRKAIVSRLRKYGDRTAILVSSLLFALLHGNLSQLFYAFGLGCLLGYVYARTGKLRYSIGLHMAINFLGSFVGVLILRLSEGVDLQALSNLDPADYAAVLDRLGPQLWFLLAIGLYGIVLFGLFIAGLVFLIRGRKQLVLAEATVALPKPGRAKAVFGSAGMIVYLLICAVLIVVSLFVQF